MLVVRGSIAKDIRYFAQIATLEYVQWHIVEKSYVNIDFIMIGGNLWGNLGEQNEYP